MVTSHAIARPAWDGQVLCDSLFPIVGDLNAVASKSCGCPSPPTPHQDALLHLTAHPLHPQPFSSSHCCSAGTSRAEHSNSSAACRPGTTEKLCWDQRGAKERGASGRGSFPSLAVTTSCDPRPLFMQTADELLLA